jgi:hypothetical protein
MANLIAIAVDAEIAGGLAYPTNPGSKANATNLLDAITKYPSDLMILTARPIFTGETPHALCGQHHMR